MLSKEIHNYWNSLTFKNTHLKELLFYVLAMLDKLNEEVDGSKIMNLIDYYIQEMNPIATRQAEQLCTSMSIIAQLLPYDKFIESYMVRMRNIAANQGAIKIYPAKNDADNRIDELAKQLETYLGGMNIETQLILPKQFYDNLLNIFEYAQELKNIMNGLIEGFDANAKMVQEAKTALAQVMMEKKALMIENDRLNALVDTLRRKIE